MTYEEVVNMIRVTAHAVNPAGFYLNAIGGRKNAAEYYNEPSPQVFTIGLRSSRTPNTPTRTWTASMLFIKQDQPDTTEAEREQILIDMDVLSTAFMNYMFNNFDADVTVTDSPENRILSGTYSGWFCQYNIITPDYCNEGS